MVARVARQPLASRQEVADYLKVPVQTLTAWASRGTGPKYHRVGVHARYQWADVDQWLADQEHRTASV